MLVIAIPFIGMAQGFNASNVCAEEKLSVKSSIQSASTVIEIQSHVQKTDVEVQVDNSTESHECCDPACCDLDCDCVSSACHWSISLLLSQFVTTQFITNHSIIYSVSGRPNAILFSPFRPPIIA